MPGEITIVGCGVSGMTVGVTFLERGYAVRIVTDKLPPQTTSARAAAIWFPFAVNPRERVGEWSRTAYDRYRQLVDLPRTGISMVWLTVLIRAEEDAWWKNALPPGNLRRAAADELPSGYPLGYKMRVPLIETQLYLTYLLDRFLELGGTIDRRFLSGLHEVAADGRTVVNCTGLGARRLCADEELYAISGQLLRVEAQPAARCIVADFPFGDKQDGLAYLIPRSDALILGGTARVGDEDLTPDDELTADIIRRCRTIAPGLGEVSIRSVRVGLRPGRSEIRLERETDSLIHNYGHGGGGFTVSWGCAGEVVRLVEGAANPLKVGVE